MAVVVVVMFLIFAPSHAALYCSMVLQGVHGAFFVDFVSNQVSSVNIVE
jgi:hypothetical protein